MKSSLYKAFSTDSSVEKEGVWVEYFGEPDEKPARFLVARAGGANKEFSKALAAEVKPYKRTLDYMPDAQAEALYMAAFVKTVLKNWENVTDPEGNDLPFNQENARKLFAWLPELYADLKAQSTNISAYRDLRLEKDLGNSGPSSTTDSSKAK